MISFTTRVHMVGLIGLAAVVLSVSPAYGQGRSMRMPQGMTVRPSPRNTPMMGQTFMQPRRFSSNSLMGTRFDRFEDRFERRSSFGRFDRFEDRFERRFGVDPFLGSPFGVTPFGVSPFLGRRFGVDPILGSPFGINPFLGSPISISPFFVP